MSIESGHDKPRIQPSETHFSADDIPQTFGPYTDAERELARQRQELAQMHEAEAKRKKRNKLIGGGTLAGLLLAGGGVFAGSKLAGGEAAPEPNQPAAEAPANPGEVEAPVDNPDASPIDTPPETDPSAPVETEPVISAENFADFSNEEIIEWYTIDPEMVATLRQDGMREFVSEHGGAVQTFDPAAFLESENAEGTIGYNKLAELQDDGSYSDMTPLYPQANTNLELTLNTILSNREMFTDLNNNTQARALAETFIVESYKDIDCRTQCYSPGDSYVFTNLVDFALSQPEGTVVTDFGLAVNKSVQDGTRAPEENGTWAVMHLRHADGSEEKVSSYRLTEGMPSAYVIDYDGNTVLWNEYKNEGQEAIMVWDSERRFAEQ